MFVGANTEQLISLTQQLKASGERFEQIGVDLTAEVTRSSWEGQDAHDFRSQWATKLHPLLKGVSERTLAAASALLRQAIEQDQASGNFDPARYGSLLEGSGWSDVINGAQDVWDFLTGNSEMDEDDLGGTITVDDPESIPVDGPEAQAVFADISEVNQGAIGDCWLISALAAVGQRDPAWIDQHIDYSDGGWDVTIYDNGQPVTIHVAADELVAQGCRDSSGDPSWMSIYEEAVAQHFGDNYRALVADSTAHGLELITGQPVDERIFPPSVQEMAAAVEAGRPITAMTDPFHPWRDDLVAAHVYIVESVDADTGEVTLVNPWGAGTYSSPHENIADRLTISYAEYRANFIMTGMGQTP